MHSCAIRTVVCLTMESTSSFVFMAGERPCGPRMAQGIANATAGGDAPKFIPEPGEVGAYPPLAKWRADGAGRGR